jgi:ribosomal protein S18 acetylase RimI-like enzyme
MSTPDGRIDCGTAKERLMTGIRIATSDDVATVEEVVRAAYGPWSERMGFRPLPLDADYRSLVVAGQVYVTEPVIDGVLVLSTEPETIGIDNVAVRPGAQRSGIGGRLMAFALDHAARNGAPSVRLYTHSAMTDNIAWYASLGFVESGREPLPVGERVHMAKDLGS